MRSRSLLLSLASLLVTACGGDDGGAPTPDGGGVDAGPDGLAGACPRTPAAVDRARFVVVAKPYDAASNRANVFEVLALSTTGALTRPGRTFEMGRAFDGTIVFTPDGEVGLIAQEDGTLGVFRLDASGTPTVVHAALMGSAYAGEVVMDPRGDRAYVLDGNTRGNGGGVSLVAIGCDGTITDHGQIAPADLPRGLRFTADGRALLGARNVLSAMTPGADVHLLAWGAPPAPLAGADAFGDDEAILGGAALSADGATYFLGDTNLFGTHRVAVIGVGPDALTPLAVLDVADPQAITTSPFGDVAVVSSADGGNRLVILDKGGAGGTWRVRGNVATVGGNPMLPGDHAAIMRGSLAGHVWVAEVTSIRHLAFRASGAVEEVDAFDFGGGVENINGAIGVTP